MHIADLYGRGQPVFSFEFFPPKTEKGFASLYRTVEELKPLGPDFVSVTWGAGGSTRRKTVEIVIRIQQEIGIASMAHLSCIGMSSDEIADYFDFVERARAAGISVPIIPGIMPIISATNIRRIATLSQARIPDELDARLSEVEHDDALTMEVGVEWTTRQCRELLDREVPGIHFYTMNKSPATRHVFQNLREQ